MKNKFKAQIIESNEATLKGKEIACNIIYDDMNKPPKWFQNWSENTFKPIIYNISNRLDKLESKVNNIETRLGKLEFKVDSIIKLNNLRVE